MTSDSPLPLDDLLAQTDWVTSLARALVAALARGCRDALRNLGRLLRDDRDELQRGVAEGLGGVGIADVLHGLPDDFVEVERGAGGDLTGQNHRVALAEGLAGHAARRVLLEAGVEDGIRNVVADLIGVSFGHRLGRERET